MFVFLVAKIQGGCSDKTNTAASLIELLHTATLVHDDVVDESPKRRGFFSIQALWKKEGGCACGRLFVSKGLLAAVEEEAFDMLKITSRAVKEISEGSFCKLKSRES